MPLAESTQFQVPPYLVTFFVAGLGLVFAAILIRSAVKGAARREEGKKRFRRLLETVRELSNQTEADEPLIGSPRVRTVHEETTFTLWPIDEKRLNIVVGDLEGADPLESLPWVIRHPSRPAWLFPMAWSWFTPIRRRRLDWAGPAAEFEFYLPSPLHGYLNELENIGGGDVAAQWINGMDDITRMEDQAVRDTIQRVGISTLTVALLTAREDLREKFFRNAGEDSVERLRAELNSPTPQSPAKIEEAQGKVLTAARRAAQRVAPNKRGGLEASLVVLQSLRGVKKFRLECADTGTLLASFWLDSEDLLARPDLIESLLHHLRRLRTLLSSS